MKETTHLAVESTASVSSTPPLLRLNVNTPRATQRESWPTMRDLQVGVSTIDRSMRRPMWSSAARPLQDQPVGSQKPPRPRSDPSKDPL
jgi:flavin reductase (DIM6/NTAB) family NADH-FMN oxidoreductase RutF